MRNNHDACEKPVFASRRTQRPETRLEDFSANITSQHRSLPMILVSSWFGLLCSKCTIVIPCYGDTSFVMV